MLAFAGLRVEGEVAQVLVVSQPPPLACVAHNIFGETPELGSCLARANFSAKLSLPSTY